MIEELKIKIINPPSSVVFPLKRRVLVEKFINHERDSHLKKVNEFFRNSIVAPGEHVWVIHPNSLNVERYTISHIREAVKGGKHSDVLKSLVYFFNKEGKPYDISVDTHDFMDFMNTSVGVYMSGIKFICSSEEDVLLRFKKFIPILINKIQNIIDQGNVRSDRQVNLKSQIKKYQKLHKKIVKFLDNE